MGRSLRAVEKAEILKLLAEGLDIEKTLKEAGISRGDLKKILLEAAGLVAGNEKAGLHLDIFIDGSCRGNPGPSGAGVVILDEEGETLMEDSVFLGEGTNNTAEYEALNLALKRAEHLGAGTVVINSDSELLVKQMQGHYRVKEPRLQQLYFKARSRLDIFADILFRHVPRKENRRADVLANLAVDEYISRRKEGKR